MEKILNVANFIFEEYKKISGVAIDEMKLHKLLYFAHDSLYDMYYDEFDDVQDYK